MRGRPKLTVAVAQILVQGDVAANLDTILRFLARAARRKADIVCFPEVCLVHDEENVVPIDTHLRAIGQARRRLRVWCLVGSYQKAKGRVENCAFLFDRAGRLRHRYVKVHLWGSEIDNGVVPGRRSGVLKTELGTIGIIICFDFAFPEFIKKLSLQGAEVIFCPSFMVSYEGWTKMLRTMPVMRAFENTAYFVHCDAVTADRRTAAMSFIAAPQGVIRNHEGSQSLMVATLDLAQIRQLKRNFRILREK